MTPTDAGAGNRSRVYVHPAPGTYARIPVKSAGDDTFGYKVVPGTSEKGEPFDLVFIDPKNQRDPNRRL